MIHTSESPSPYITNPYTVLITGGTGSFGSAMTACLIGIQDGPRVRVYSRNEDNQANMMRVYPPGPRLTYILGDVRDVEHLTRAADGCTHIIHSAALKQVPMGQVNSEEFTKTNIYGTSNVIRAAIDAGVGRSIFVSSDKAVAPINHYGATKAAAEGAFINANRAGVSRDCKFAVVRGGNVWASRGSVALRWRDAKAAGKPLQVFGAYDADGNLSTRFHMEMNWWTNFVWQACQSMHGGEIFIPKIRAWHLRELSKAFDSDAIYKAGRAGDKSHEIMWTSDEARRVIDTGEAFVVEPSPDLRDVWNYSPWKGEAVTGEYSSRTADKLNITELKELVKSL